MDIFSIAAAKKLAGSGGGTGGTGVVQKQSDWNQNDSTQKDYIKNRPFYYGEIYVEDLVFPTPNELYVTTTVASDADQGFALLGQKANFVVGQTYTYEVKINIGGEVVHTATIELTAYSLSTIGLPATFADAVVLVDSNDNPYILSGAILTDLKNFSDITLADDTMFLTYKSHQEDKSFSITCKGYNNMAQAYKKIDINYIPIDKIGIDVDLPAGSIKATQLADGAVTSDKLASDAISASNITFATNSIDGNVLKDGTVTRLQIADSAISNSQIDMLTIQTKNLADNSITTAKIAEPVLVSSSTLTSAVAQAVYVNNDDYGEVLMKGIIKSTDTENLSQVLVLYDGHVSVNPWLSIPLDFSSDSALEVTISIKRYKDWRLAEVYVYSRSQRKTLQHISGIIPLSCDSFIIRLGDSSTQQFDIGTKIDWYGITSGWQ